ncbi:hypothetical protein GW17_00031261 [Ensete ventricosum]|nr:hypothetical protein GW17_00031261 [Ensete ventricosum]
MTPKASTGEFPFSLAFGTETILPPEVVFPTLRTKNFERGASEQGLQANLDLIEGHRAEAHLRTLTYQRVIALLYNRKVCPQSVSDGDLVLRKAKVSNPRCTRGKLAPNWE